jgi:tetratricopeptide (TPR) repeat protein
VHSVGMSRESGTTASGPLRVFLSHTSDLSKPDESGSFVAAAVNAVLRARHAVTDMAYFAARDTSPAAHCVNMVAQSDVYVGIIGLRYGSAVRDRPDVSYTELEFEAAGELDQPRLIFLIREDSAHLPSVDEVPDGRARQDAFRRRLFDAGLTTATVTTPAELELAVYQALVELSPTPNAPARLAAAQALLASMPTDALPQRGALPAGSRMPLAANPLFVGRGDELLQIAAALRGGDTTVALGQVVASTGLGGLGKTQLAAELVHRYGRFFAGGVYWLSFANADEIPLQVAACAGPGAMDLAPGIEDQPVEERVQRVRRAWQSAAPRLLLFDNCEDEALLDAWRPVSGGCRVLVTSRRSHWSPTLGVAALALDLLPRTDSIELVRRYRPDLAPDDPVLDALATELGDLPLALHLAGSYLRTYRAEVSPDGYLAELRRESMVQHASLLGAGLDDSPSPTHHVQSVAQTFALCLSRLDREREVDQVAIALLARIACMAPGELVPRELLAKTMEEVEGRRLADGLRRLAEVGLVGEGEDRLRLHRLLVHFVRQESLEPDASPAVVRALIACGKDVEHGHLTGSALAVVIPHFINGAAASSTGDQRLAAELYTAAGTALQYMGDLSAAGAWFERASEVLKTLAVEDVASGRPRPQEETLRAYWRARIQRMQGTLELHLGHPVQALQRLQASLKYFETSEHWEELSQVCYELGWAHSLLGDVMDAISWDRHGIEYAELWNRTSDRHNSRSLLQGQLFLGGHYLDVNDLARARHHLQQADAISQDPRLGHYYDVGRVSLLLGRLSMREGDLEQAHPHVQTALDFFAGRPEQRMLAAAHNVMGDFHLANGGSHLQNALDHYSLALLATRSRRAPNTYYECAAMYNICRARISVHRDAPAGSEGARGVETLLRGARELGRTHRYHNHLARLAVLQAEWALQNGDASAARNAAREALHQANAFGSHLVAEICSHLGRLGLPHSLTDVFAADA